MYAQLPRYYDIILHSLYLKLKYEKRYIWRINVIIPSFTDVIQGTSLNHFFSELRFPLSFNLDPSTITFTLLSVDFSIVWISKSVT